MKYLSFLAFLCCGQFLFAQNLVVNYSFEKTVLPASWRPCEHISKPATFNGMAKGWQTFQSLTPDLVWYDSTSNTCDYLPKPHSGKGMLGAILYHPFTDAKYAFDYHEFVQGTLAKPLEKGKTYRISFWVWSDDSLGTRHLTNVYGHPTSIRSVQCNNFGFYFSTDPSRADELFHLSIRDFELRPQVNLDQIVPATASWQKMSIDFKADKAYKYFVFGNFYSDAITATSLSEEERQKIDAENTRENADFWKKTKRIAYYLFDDFAIVDADLYKQSAVEKQLTEHKKYVFSEAVLFETGQWALKSQAFAAIDELAAFLKKSPTVKIDIRGYADSEGAEQSNLTLSSKRAETVYRYLLDQKIDASRLSFQGLGERDPVADNATEEGRRQNRRVEIIAL